MTNEDKNEEIMIEIGNTLVSLDLAERFFCCDLDQCLGQCCIEGDAGAPITTAEQRELERVLPYPSRHIVITGGEPSLQLNIDEEGDLVTSIVGGRDCVFTCHAPGGKCLCAIDSAFRQGLTGSFRKPISCYLYPLRLTEYPSFTAVNYHRWKICRSAEANGRRLGIRLYQFMKDPLTERFGKEWYDELVQACEAIIENRIE
jgi:hypothetical protein